MASKYWKIRRDNRRRYGTDVGRIAPVLLVKQYADRTHFIFELLQNAEDALAKRDPTWSGKRSIRFELRNNELRVSHFGKPFDEADVRGICGIVLSTKDVTAIGKFGIGFKSVYAVTDRPVVYSGDESFAIEGYVYPEAVTPIERDPEETVIVIPLRNRGHRVEIEGGLRRLGADSLLFLRAIEEIEWSVEGGPCGRYLRRQPKPLGDNIRQVTLVGQAAGAADVEESWLIFSRPVNSADGAAVGHVEVAFSLRSDDKSDRKRLEPIALSPLVVFFPTALETHLRFRIQGPYGTTPSRDNVPAKDPWNQHCVAETAALLRDALLWLRDNDYLDVDALRCLPLDRAKFPEDAMFAPIFETVREVLADEPLLPRHGGGYVSAKHALLARTKDLRELLSPTQITTLFEAEAELAWLSGDITPERTPELHEYLIEELGIKEIRPDTLLDKLSKTFLEAQSDEWVRRLYEVLGRQWALHHRLSELPLVRLEDGTHVPAQVNGKPQAYLPGAAATGFPTVRAAVCDTEQSKEFLESLGLTEPDLVDDVIINVLPRYATGEIAMDAATYATDIERILRAYRTDSESRKRRLVEELRKTPFVAAREQGTGAPRMARPDEVYLATERLSQLFKGVGGVLIVDDSYACLKGEDVRQLLEAAGAVRYLRPVEGDFLSWEEKRELRERAGHRETSGLNDHVEDYSLVGLEGLLRLLPRLEPQERRERAKALWEELGLLEERRGSRVFTAVYTWTHYGRYRKETDAAFIRLLNKKKWVPDEHDRLCAPSTILFDFLEKSHGWQPNAFLLSKIDFKSPAIEQLAREAGFEPGLLELLKKRGITSEEQLRELLGDDEEAPDDDGESGGVTDAIEKLGISAPPTPPVLERHADHSVPSGESGRGVGAGSGGDLKRGDGARSGAHTGTRDVDPGVGAGKRTAGSPGGRPFISYVGVHPDEEEVDPDGLDHAARMALEESAIELILDREPSWQRTPTNNTGFDLFEPGPDGEPVRWCEVKAMTGSLEERPVGLSHAQFECAREHGEDYWLYVVEHANTDRARIVRIQDPAGKARTFTFDRGWLNVAKVDPESGEREE